MLECFVLAVTTLYVLVLVHAAESYNYRPDDHETASDKRCVEVPLVSVEDRTFSAVVDVRCVAGKMKAVNRLEDDVRESVDDGSSGQVEGDRGDFRTRVGAIEEHGNVVCLGSEKEVEHNPCYDIQNNKHDASSPLGESVDVELVDNMSNTDDEKGNEELSEYLPLTVLFQGSGVVFNA